MNIPRLHHLITILRAIPAEKLTMASFYAGDLTPSTDEGVSCGTTACALGWASLDPHFQSEGLKPSKHWCYPVYNTLEVETEGFAAARKFFDIDYRQCNWLFSDGCYLAKGKAKPSTVIQHIRDVLTGRKTDIDPQYPLT